jgi:hypothetical protein
MPQNREEQVGPCREGQADRLSDEHLRELLRCDSKALVIGPRKRTYAETTAYVDQMRQTERWLELCAVFGEFARTQGDSDSEEGVKLAAAFMAVVQLMMDFTGAELGELPRSWVTGYLGDDFHGSRSVVLPGGPGMSAFYTPQTFVVAARLVAVAGDAARPTGGDYQAAALLCEIMRRYPYAKATLPGKDGRWSANEREEWFKAVGLTRNQGDRALARLEERGLIERAHGSWGGNPNVLYVRPTERAQIFWNAATTFEAIDQLLKGDESGPLHQLWQAWPAIDGIDPKKAGAIAKWYEELDDRKMTRDVVGQSLNLKPCALDLLQRILESDPTIVDAKAEDLRSRLWAGVHSIVIEEDATGGLAPVDTSQK